MKKQLIVIGLVFAGLVGIVLLLNPRAPAVAARPVKLVITGPEGQQFTGSYVADGVTNTLSAVVPATIRLSGRKVTYEFKPGDAREEFRVALDVEELHRTSFVSYKGKSVRGGWHYWGSGESAW